MAVVLDTYRDDPVGFVEEVLGDAPYAKQREMLEAVVHNRRVSVVGANGSGQDWAAARAVLWWIATRPQGHGRRHRPHAAPGGGDRLAGVARRVQGVTHPPRRARLGLPLEHRRRPVRHRLLHQQAGEPAGLPLAGVARRRHGGARRPPGPHGGAQAAHPGPHAAHRQRLSPATASSSTPTTPSASSTRVSPSPPSTPPTSPARTAASPAHPRRRTSRSASWTGARTTPSTRALSSPASRTCWTIPSSAAPSSSRPSSAGSSTTKRDQLLVIPSGAQLPYLVIPSGAQRSRGISQVTFLLCTNASPERCFGCAQHDKAGDTCHSERGAATHTLSFPSGAQRSRGISQVTFRCAPTHPPRDVSAALNMTKQGIRVIPSGAQLPYLVIPSGERSGAEESLR